MERLLVNGLQVDVQPDSGRWSAELAFDGEAPMAIEAVARSPDGTPAQGRAQATVTVLPTTFVGRTEAVFQTEGRLVFTEGLREWPPVVLDLETEAIHRMALPPLRAFENGQPVRVVFSGREGTGLALHRDGVTEFDVVTEEIVATYPVELDGQTAARVVDGLAPDAIVEGFFPNSRVIPLDPSQEEQALQAGPARGCPSPPRPRVDPFAKALFFATCDPLTISEVDLSDGAQRLVTHAGPSASFRRGEGPSHSSSGLAWHRFNLQLLSTGQDGLTRSLLRIDPSTGARVQLATGEIPPPEPSGIDFGLAQAGSKIAVAPGLVYLLGRRVLELGLGDGRLRRQIDVRPAGFFNPPARIAPRGLSTSPLFVVAGTLGVLDLTSGRVEPWGATLPLSQLEDPIQPASLSSEALLVLSSRGLYRVTRDSVQLVSTVDDDPRNVGSGESWSSPRALAILDENTAVVTSRERAATQLLLVDLRDGSRRLLASFTRGEGPSLFPLTRLRTENGRLLFDRGREQIRVDLQTGDRVIEGSVPDPLEGIELEVPGQLDVFERWLDEERSILWAYEGELQDFVAIDLEHGQIVRARPNPPR